MITVLKKTVVVEPLEKPTQLKLLTVAQPTVIERFITGPQGPAGAGGADGKDEAVVDLNAAEDLAQFAVVTIDGALADSSNSQHFGRVLGLTQAAIVAGFTGKVTLEGALTNPLWTWSPGQKLFLNGTMLSTSPPTTGFAQMVAVAKTADTIVVRLGTPVLL